MFFDRRIAFNFFDSECGNPQVLKHFGFKMMFSFAVTGTTRKFIKHVRMKERWNTVFECKKDYHYAIYFCAYLKGIKIQ